MAINSTHNYKTVGRSVSMCINCIGQLPICIFKTVDPSGILIWVSKQTLIQIDSWNEDGQRNINSIIIKNVHVTHSKCVVANRWSRENGGGQKKNYLFRSHSLDLKKIWSHRDSVIELFSVLKSPYQSP